MAVSLDLRKAHLSRNYGDIAAVFSWINDQRALFLIPHRRRGAPWFIVMEPAAHEWNDQDHWAMGALIPRAVKACDVLGIEPTPRNARRIVGIVNDSIADLVRMPSSPPAEYVRGSFGDLHLFADGKQIATQPMRHEDVGVSYGVANG